MKKFAFMLALAVLLSGCSVQAGSMPGSGSSSSAQVEDSVQPLKVLDNNGSEAGASSGASSQETMPDEDQEDEEMQSEMLKKAAALLDLYWEESSGNAMLSPASLYAAIGLAANGADGQTLKEMEQFLGISTKKANELYQQMQDDAVLKTANSVWYRNQDNALKMGSLTPKETFKEIAANSYHADFYECDFTDPSTINRMNQWASSHTDGMIPEIVSRLEPNTAMALLNALLFEGLWIQPYDKSHVKEEDFTLFDGSVVQAEMLSSKESVYMENDKAVGFMKGYQDGYTFAAVLPKETGAFTLEELSLDTLLESASSRYEVYTKLPKFTFSCGGSLVELMKKAGVTDAFQEGKADFSNLFQEDTPIWIGDVVQKTKIELSESGTKAAAVTSVMFMARAAMIPETMRKEVYLDRPFAFLILKDGMDIPLFAGVVENPKAG